MNVQTIGPKTFDAMSAPIVFRDPQAASESQDGYAGSVAFDLDSIYLNPAPLCRSALGFGAARVTAALLSGLTSGLLACSYLLG